MARPKEMETPKSYDSPQQLTLFFPEEHALAIPPKQNVWISNYLARAQFYSKTVWTERVFVAACSYIKKGEEIPDNFTISIPEISPSRSGQLYEDDVLEEIADNLVQEEIKVRFPDAEGNIQGGVTANLFDYAAYMTKSKQINVKLTETMKKLVYNQITEFTSFNKEEFMQLSTVYAQRLFRFLCSNRYDKWGNERPTYTVILSVLIEQLNPPEWVTKNFGEFERKILKPAVQNINKGTFLKVSYDKIALKGRKIEQIAFLFNDVVIIKAQADEQKPEKKKTETMPRNKKTRRKKTSSDQQLLAQLE